MGTLFGPWFMWRQLLNGVQKGAHMFDNPPGVHPYASWFCYKSAPCEISPGTEGRRPFGATAQVSVKVVGPLMGFLG